MPTRVELLGGLAVTTADGRTDLPMRKTSALLAYLAFKSDWVRRSELLYLFWADSEERKAQGNLRQLVHALKDLTYAQGLELNKDSLRWHVASDLADFRQAYAEKAWERVVERYPGELLEGFYTPGIPEFNDWLATGRAQLEAQWQEAAWQLSESLLATERHKEALAVLARLQQRSLDERHVRAYLRVLLQMGQRQQAQQVLDGYTKQLEELGASPEAETWALLESASGQTQPVVTLPTPEKPSALPRSLSSFVGRLSEKAFLHTWLDHDSERLLILTGPGGIGKTRLALEFARETKLSSGVVFVALEVVSTDQALEVLLAQALSFKFYGDKDAKAQLFDYLKDKQMLIILDNFEHLLAEVSFIEALLRETHYLKVLVTSRERLNLQTEQVLRLMGLSYPQISAAQDGSTFDAVELFLQRASRLSPQLTRSSENLAQVVDICQLVDGMPLALELLAAWANVLSLGEIARELRTGMHLLEHDLRDLPERHQSMRVVFEGSWQQLSQEARRAFRHMIVFQGGFSFNAARAVIDIRPRVLKTLVNKSLLRVQTQGRYDLHPLIAQYLREKPLSNAKALQQRHASYYLEALNLENTSDGNSVLLLSDYENVRAAWLWATRHAPASLSPEIMQSIFQFHMASFRPAALLEWLNLALEHETVLNKKLLGKLYSYKASLLHVQGHDLTQILMLAEKAKTLLDPEVETKEYLELLHRLSTLYKDTGQYQQARNCAEEAVVIAKQEQNPRLSLMLMTLGHCEDTLGNFIAARALYEEAMVLQKKAQNLRETCYAQLATAHTYYLEEDHEAALQWCEAGLALSLETQNHYALRYLQLEQLRIWIALERNEQAQTLAAELMDSEAVQQDETLRTNILVELAKIALYERDYRAAHAYFKEALTIVWSFKDIRLLLEYLCAYVRLLEAEGTFESAWQIASFVASHPQASWARQRQASLLAERLQAYATAETTWDEQQRTAFIEKILPS